MTRFFKNGSPHLPPAEPRNVKRAIVAAKVLTQGIRAPRVRRRPKAGKLSLPVGISTLKELAKADTLEAYTVVITAMRTSPSEAIRLAAASAILDRGWGKPAQAITDDEGKSATPPTIIFEWGGRRVADPDDAKKPVPDRSTAITIEHEDIYAPDPPKSSRA